MDIPQTTSIPQVQNSFIYAGFWKRFSAAFIDGMFLVTILCLGLLLVVMTGYSIEPTVLSGLLPYLFAVIAFLYNPVLEASSWQGSIGKKLLGLSVTDMTGQRISFGRALGRNVGKFLSSIFFIGYFMVAFTEKKQGLHDLMAGCLVVKNKPEQSTALRLGILVAELIVIGGTFAYAYTLQQQRAMVVGQAEANLLLQNLQAQMQQQQIQEDEASTSLDQGTTNIPATK